MDKTLRNALTDLSTEDLARRRRAMGPFIKATFGLFSRCLYRHLGNEVECEDVLEDVYADIWEDARRLSHVRSERELVHTVYLYYMRKRLRQVYRRLNRTLALPQETLMSLVAPDWGVFDAMSQTEHQQLIERAMCRLKARERRAVELWSQGMSNRMIANELKTTVGAVKMLLYRTMLKLRKLTKSYCHEEV